MGFKKFGSLLELILLIYILSPVIFKYSTFIQRSLLFMNQYNTHHHIYLSHPESLGIECSRLLHLEHPNELDSNEPVIELGAWHILPESSLPSCTTDHLTNRTTIDDKLAFSDSRPIVLYIHGNGGNRAGRHRSRLYKRLASEHDYHIVTFDYRGYGDSTYEAPTTFGLTSDARFMYDWLLQQPGVTKDRVIVWGHSLGTAVAVRMVANLPQDRQPRRLVLEAPFDSLANAIANHPFSTPFRIIPYFEYFFIEPIQKSPELNFDSLSRIGDIKSTAILILHAEDDAIIPYKLGQNLFKEAAKKLGKSRVKFITISANQGLGHKHICDHDETMLKVKQFIGAD
uniref:Monoacylglycerol lipase ABHD12 n=1 Tax=Aceria tosichella TaxID=561515 RepID=A0A6G1S977_9ACAR